MRRTNKLITALLMLILLPCVGAFFDKTVKNYDAAEGIAARQIYAKSQYAAADAAAGKNQGQEKIRPGGEANGGIFSIFDAKRGDGGGALDSFKKFFDGLLKTRSKDGAPDGGEPLKHDDVYLGGAPLGISLSADGLIVTGKNDVITKTGIVSPSAKTGIMNGDVLTYIDGVKINRPEDIAAALKNNDGRAVRLKLRRGVTEYEETIRPVEDSLTGVRRLGLAVKSDLLGIGTLTFVNDDGRYGALGHQIVDAETGIKDLNAGEIYDCSIIGIIRGERNKAGELRGLINKNEGPLGTIDKNGSFGIFGQSERRLIDGLEKIPVGGKYSVKPGKAQIRTTIAGNIPRLYDIEIIKTSFQNGKNEKGMIIRVTDAELLEATGGILQGMSGSPIIQEGKLVGAVTHVFINDPTKGYGMYIDWMLNE
ncbi:MAG: SpoIVB peptidase [Clostridiales bacterium]|jgi:stage IV sporulation protein B|nr:SpoIVB peptidase [Clostridiales bacterium]